MKNYKAIFLTILLLTGTLWVASGRSQSQSGLPSSIGQNSNITQIGGASVNTDPCGSWGTLKKSVAINVSASATTTSIVAVSGATAVFVCGFNIEVTAGTTPTFQFEYGTGAACTGPTVLSGPYMGEATTLGLSDFLYGGGEMTIMQVPASNGVCIVTGGTTPSIVGVVTYVQQ